MKIYDLSLNISSKMLVFPGDPKPKIKSKTFAKKDGLTLSKISLLSHTGTHLDAPKHFFKNGKSVDKIDIETIVGPCKVVDLTNFFKAGGPAEVGWAHFGRAGVRKGDRLLVKTGNFVFLHEKKINKKYISISQDATKNLCKRQISLIGFDYITIEREKNEGYPVHKMFLKEGIVILEGLDLKDVPAGEYLLVCAPLKLEGCDGSPARVYLIKE